MCRVLNSALPTLSLESVTFVRFKSHLPLGSAWHDGRIVKSDVRIRPARPDDATTIHRFVCALAEYEREPHAVQATPEVFRAQLEQDPAPFGCLIAEVDGQAAGFALYFPTYSTWRGRSGIYLEDLYVDPAYRRRGIARSLVARLARLVVERRWGRLEWSVLDWNEPAIAFYRALGASAQPEWGLYRMSEEALLRLVAASASDDS